MRFARNKDRAHGPIVDALRAVGATVQALDAKDVPDLLVGYRGQTYLLEVKSPATEKLRKKSGKVYRGDAGKLSDGQAKWLASWRGGAAYVVTTPDEALQAIGAKAGAAQGAISQAFREHEAEVERICAPKDETTTEKLRRLATPNTRGVKP